MPSLPLGLLNVLVSPSYESSSSVMAPFFANHSCDPFAPESSPCDIGVYVRYAIRVTEPQDIAIGLAFAMKRNIRVVIRNTGHEYSPTSKASWFEQMLTFSAIWANQQEMAHWLYGRIILRTLTF